MAVQPNIIRHSMITTVKTTEEGRGKETDGKISGIVLLLLHMCSRQCNNLALLWLLWHHLHCSSNHLLVLRCLLLHNLWLPTHLLELILLPMGHQAHYLLHLV